MDKGASKPLNVTKEAQHRVFVGLGWDPADSPNIVQKVKAIAKGKETHHDLDLSCFAYDQDKSFIGHVSALPELASMADDKIYHSGDNEEGIGEGDDEEISVELKDLPNNIHNLIFTAAVTSGQTFGHVKSPEIRIADGYTNHNFLRTDIAQNEGQDDDLYIFIKLSKQDGKWHLTNLDTYLKDAEISDYEEHLRNYL